MTQARPLASPAAPASLRALLAGLIDYAGLYPPAELPMPGAVAEYARQRTSHDAWVLGRFVVAAVRLDEFVAALGAHRAAGPGHWPLSVLLGADPVADLAAIERWEKQRLFTIDALEFKAGSTAEIDRLVELAGEGRQSYVEIPLATDPAPLLERLARRGALAKARTGGVTPEIFPSTAQVVRFFGRTAEIGLPFKLTAGLHHPLMGEYRLTYRPDAASGRMFGFLTMFAAAAAARQRWPAVEIAALVEERDGAALRFEAGGLHWRNRLITTEALVQTREDGAISFGSCSFEEPLTELRGIGYLPA